MDANQIVVNIELNFTNNTMKKIYKQINFFHQNIIKKKIIIIKYI
jgi:polyphosphate kinase 2 (PPK2 family)